MNLRLFLYLRLLRPDRAHFSFLFEFMFLRLRDAAKEMHDMHIFNMSEIDFWLAIFD